MFCHEIIDTGFFPVLKKSLFLVLFVSAYIIRTIAYWLEDKWLIFNAIWTVVSILLCPSVMIRNFLMGQWLGLRALTTEGLGSIPVKGTKISLALQSKKKTKTKKNNGRLPQLSCVSESTCRCRRHVPFLVWEDSTCFGVTKPVSHTTELWGAQSPCSAAREATTMRGLCPAARSSPCN